MVKSRKNTAVPKDESKREKFIRVVIPRVRKAIKAIGLIGNQAGSAYEYTEQDVACILVSLHDAVDAVEKRYSSSGKQEVDFTLD